ncbi:Sec23-binding domain of Sec16-domain-containing protein [Hypoxylon sp. NC1633]|nr:Sec23-binding domain of Sec16-domain-containing protein [Hypoxylon sp. NC1633]
MDTPSATWHPAMMPNYNGNKQQPELDWTSNLEEQTIEHPTEDTPDDHVIDEEFQPHPQSHGAFLDQFDNHDSRDSAWDLSDPLPASAAQGDDALISNGERDAAQPEPVPTSNMAKHTSTISFARTVSHEVSFNDDEDTEWNLQRTETDPFKFMPPNDRTNSFPAVPQIENVTEDQMDYPPPSTQAQDLLHDLEKDSPHADSVAQAGFAETLGEDPAIHENGDSQGVFQQYVGGDLVGAEEEQLDARFEEGLPLIPQNEQQNLANHREPEAPDLGNDFAQGDVTEGGDDFFSQISQERPQTKGDGALNRALQRKSTNMVMGQASISDSELPTPDEGTSSNVPDVPDASTHNHFNGEDSSAITEGKEETRAQTGVDIDAKWAAAFDDDDDDFLVDSALEPKELDPADIFGSDDEGFLEETMEETPAPLAESAYHSNTVAQPHSASLNGRYTPDSLQHSAQPSPNLYAPTSTIPQTQPSQQSYVHPATAPPPAMGGYGPPPPKPTLSKAQSFADKSKGGYSSPYDLPMEVMKPKKRVSMQQLPRANMAPLVPPAGPPRSASMYNQPPPSGGSTTSLSPPTQRPTPQLKPKPAPYGQPQTSPLGGPPTSSISMLSPPQSHANHAPHTPPEQAASIPSLIAPERASPYASLQSSSQPKPGVPLLPVTNGGAHPPAANARYSPAPPSVRSSSGGYTPVPPPTLAHQPRTSSPLAHSHFELSNDKSMPNPVNGEGTSEVEEEPSPLRSPPMITSKPPTPPPVASPAYNAISPPKRSASSYEVNFAPPPRSQTQSPGALYGRVSGKPADPVPRPSSVQGATVPRDIPNADGARPTVRAQLDPLRRWRGVPVITWGVGGTLVTSFPTDVPRYGMNQALPMVDIQPLEERLAKFPGPLKGKSKKKETRSLPHVSFQQSVSHEDKRAVERVLLWKILRVFIENDGLLEGNPAVDNAVRDAISPSLNANNPALASAISTGADLTGLSSAVTGMQADAVDSTAIEQIRHHLISGDREKAVWAAVDKRLWGHAMLISSTMQGPDLYKKVAQEFIKKEVNHPGLGNESLAALYGVLSGNFEESVDELVPVHARAGLQLMSTATSVGAWRETLGLVLSNRSFGDAQALRSLGNLLSGYGRAEAAHICYIFARNCAVFGGLDDPNVNFADQFAKETEALLLSEVYEYGLSLAGGSNIAQGCPHLAADRALQYCEGIYNTITAQTKRSPYYNQILETSAPKEESSSWIPKPRMDQVSNNMWSRFNKFVAGDDDDNSGNGTSGDAGADSGPFSRLATGTPTISRSPSVSNFDMYGNGGPSPTTPATKVTSRYAPMAPQSSNNPYDPSTAYNSAPRSSMERTSGEMTRSSNELPRRGSDMQSAAYGNPYTPESNTFPTSGYQPTAPAASQTSPYMPSIQRSESSPQPTGIGISFSGYSPYGAAQTSNPDISQPNDIHIAESKSAAGISDTSLTQGYQPPSYGFSGGYEPPSYQPSSFEPPSYEPGPVEGEGGSQTESQRKKSFFDDDDGEALGMKWPRKKVSAKMENGRRKSLHEANQYLAKRAAEAKAAKKGWGFGGWFGGGAKKEPAELPNKPIKAKLGEESTFVYDINLQRWVNKKPGAENTPAKTATPPPPRAASRTGTPPPPGPTSAPPGGLSVPPAGPPRPQFTPSPALLSKPASQESLTIPSGAPPMMMRSVSNQSTLSASGGPPSAPPSRPATSLSNASSIDDLLGAAGPRKGGKKARKSGRYVDVMAK